MSATPIRELDVAVVGLALRLPGASSPAAFWRNLASGVDSVARDLQAPSGFAPAGGRYVGAEGVVLDADELDADFFGFSPAEAARIDPQHRVLLTCCWEAFEHAGYPPETCPRLTGVFVGCGANTYLLEAITNGGEELGDTLALAIGNEKDYAATRIAYKLNLRGPAISVQSACSSSLAAVHLACQALLSGDADMAVAGGAALRFPLGRGYVHREGATLAPDGVCRPFDGRAAGTVPGNGAGVVVLKRLEDAIAAGDRIHGTLRGSAVNNDGAAKVGYTAPSARAQADVMRSALAHADVEPDEVDFVETHGTGTDLGDRIELTALLEVFGARSRPCLLGALKSSIGHLEAAAGVAGLIKTLLALEHRQVPPTLHFETPNETLAGTRALEVVTELRDWTRPDGEQRLAGVSSFGIGGTNVHVVVASAPVREPRAPRPLDGSAPALEVLPLSARRPDVVAEAAERLARHLRATDDSLADVAFTLQDGRRAFEHRRALVAGGADDVARLLEDVRDAVRAGSPSIVYVFGADELPAGSGRRIAAAQPRFASALEECARTGDPAGTAATVAVEWAAASFLVDAGLLPAAVAARGAGCLAAAALAGVIGLEDALRVAAALGDADAVEERLASAPLRSARFPLACGPDERWVGTEATSPSFWAEQLAAEEPLDAALAAAGTLSAPLFVAVGATGARAAHPWLEALPRPATEHEERDALETVARAWELGASVRWESLRRPGGRRVALPTYPFAWQRHTVLNGRPRPAPRVAPEAEEELGTAVYLEGWRPFPVASPAGPAGLDAVVVGEDADARPVAEWIRAHGGAATTLAPAADADGARGLAESLESAVRDRAADGPAAVLVVPPPEDRAGVSEALATLTAVAQGVDRAAAPARIGLLARGAAAVPGRTHADALHALLVGAAKAIPLDVRHASLVAVERGSDSADDLAAAVGCALAPEAAGEHGFRLLAVAGGSVWTEQYRALAPAELPQAPAGSPGAYVVFGTGKGGLLAAEHLARTVESPTLVLASPSATRGGARGEIAALEALGATVLLRDRDVTSLDAVASVRAEAERHGPVRGVVHAVGRPRGLLLQASDLDAVGEIVLPKAAGAEVLLEVFDSPDLERVVFYSSSMARSGAIGHFAYGAGNSYLDGVARRAAAAGDPRVTTIAWPIFRWTDVAEDIAPELQSFLRGLREERGLDRDEALAILDRLPVAGFPAVAVAREDPLRTAERHRALAARFWSELAGGDGNGRPRPRGDAPEVTHEAALETIRRIWQQTLGVASVEPDAEFVLLGGHSLLLVQIIGGIHEELGVEVPVQLAYRASTPAAQAALVVELAAGGVPALEEVR